MTDTAPDSVLAPLNASERELLLLLGQGHTAKSIAVLKDMSELAVNERFRSARRKTGIGSSREIARLLVAQENRDDIIGVAEPDAPVAPLPRPDVPRRASPLRRWSLPMSAAALLIAAAVLAQQTSAPADPADQIIDIARSVFATDASRPDLDALHAEVAAGREDPAWSSATEAALLTAYRGLPLFIEGADSLRARCSATLCEVTGISPLSLDGDGLASVRFMILTGNALGLDQEYGHSRSTTDTPQKVVLVAYWRRRAD